MPALPSPGRKFDQSGYIIEYDAGLATHMRNILDKLIIHIVNVNVDSNPDSA